MVSADGRTLATRASRTTPNPPVQAGGEQAGSTTRTTGCRVRRTSRSRPTAEPWRRSATGRAGPPWSGTPRRAGGWPTSPGTAQQLIAMEFTPDGRRLVFGSLSGTLLINIQQYHHNLVHSSRHSPTSPQQSSNNQQQPPHQHPTCRHTAIDLQHPPTSSVCAYGPVPSLLGHVHSATQFASILEHSEHIVCTHSPSLPKN